MGPVLLDLQVGDVVTLKKAHPCGTNRWEVVRLGADIGLRCGGCGRRLLIERLALSRRVKRIQRRGTAAPHA